MADRAARKKSTPAPVTTSHAKDTRKDRHLEPVTITVYGKPRCQACKATTRKLDQLGITYTYTDITEDPDAYTYVTSLGYQEAPVVTLSNGMNWSGFRPERIKYLTEGV